MTDLAHLKALALRATEGEWRVRPHGSRAYDDFVIDGPALDLPYCKEHDASFIAAMNPTTALALVERVAAAEAEVERLHACLAKANAGFEEYERKYYLAMDELEALRGRGLP